MSLKINQHYCSDLCHGGKDEGKSYHEAGHDFRSIMLTAAEKWINLHKLDHSPGESPPRDLHDDMWMMCLYGVYIEAVNHRRPGV